MENILLIDKPKGITSFDVIRKLREKLDVKKMGHAGTLDPLASGLLIMGIDEGTKKMHELLGKSKVYETEIVLGVSTETDDAEGKILEDVTTTDLEHDKIKEAVASLQGTLNLPVPVYSAIKQKGKPLYWYARKGETVTPPVKEMVVHEIELIGASEKDNHLVVEVRMNVGSGVYVRSVAVELGKRLGVPASVIELRRTSIGEFNVEDAKKLEDF